MKDHYKTLGVKESSTDDELKAAYRKLAKENHPDVNKAANAESKFKEINEAYDTLKDPKKKAIYLQEKMYGPNKNYGQGPEWKVYEGRTAGFEDIFSSIFTGRRRVRTKNEDITGKYDATLEEVFEGIDVEVNFKYQHFTKKVRIQTPAGVVHGTRLKFPGRGDHTDTKLPPGDLIVQVLIKPHPIFQRNNDNLYCALDIHVIDAIIGIEMNVTTIDKKTVRVKIPPGTRHDAILKVPGYGMNVNGKRGILYVQCKLQVPNNITFEQKELLLKFKTL